MVGECERLPWLRDMDHRLDLVINVMTLQKFNRQRLINIIIIIIYE